MKPILRIFRQACATAACLAIVSCGGRADYRDLLPADLYVAMSVNPASLVKKSGVEPGKSPLVNRLEAEIGNTEELTAEEKEYLLGLLKNPAESGIDLNKELFVFMSMDGSIQDPVARGGVLLPIADKARFDALIGRINAKTGSEATTERGVSVVRIGQQPAVIGVCAYNDIACVLYFVSSDADDAEVAARSLFAQKRSESLMGDKAVAERLTAENDINMVVAYDGMKMLMNSPMLSSIPIVDALKGALSFCSINFEKGRIVSDSSIISITAESRKKLEDFYSFAKPQTGALLRYLPARSIGATGFGLDGAKLYAMLTAMPGYGALATFPVVKQVMDTFDGDLALVFTGMNPSHSPVASLLAEVKDPAVVQTLIANIPGIPIEQTGEGAYRIETGGMTVYFGVKEKVLYLTTDASVRSALNGTKIESLKSLEKIFRDKTATLYLDVEGLRSMSGLLFGGDTQEAALTYELLSLFDTVEVYGDTKGSRLIIEMADKERNALESFCEGTNALARRYAPELNL